MDIVGVCERKRGGEEEAECASVCLILFVWQVFLIAFRRKNLHKLYSDVQVYGKAKQLQNKVQSIVLSFQILQTQIKVDIFYLLQLLVILLITNNQI